MDATKEPAKQSLRYLSLCSGYEGIGLGLKRLLPNLRTVAYVEIEAYPCSRMVSAMEEELLDPAPIWTNLKTFPFREFRGCVDILSGGFPCQPFSQAGQRKSTEDPRHLFPYILNGIRECRPAIVFLENVEGILSSSTGTGENVLKYVLGSLESVGYRSTAGIFSASECLDGSGRGAPHQRKRVFILGVAENEMVDPDNDGHRENAGGNQKEDSLPGERREAVCGGLPDRAGKELANSASVGCRGGQDQDGDNGQGVQEPEDKEQPVVRSEATGCSGDLRGDLWPSRPEGDHPGEDCLDGSGSLWPSRPGEAQFAWEEPRVVGDSKSVSGDDSNSRVFTKEHSREGIQGSSGGVSGNDSTGEQEDGAAQSELGRTVDGVASGVDSVTGSVDAVANRVDRLRLLGNGVVPATSERAFLVLWNRLISQD